MKIYQVINDTRGVFSEHSSFTFFIENKNNVTQWLVRDKRVVNDRAWIIMEYLNCLNKIYDKD